MGFINKALVIDWEASGLIKEYGEQTWDRGPQGIEVGAVFVEDLKSECRVGWEYTSRVRFMQSSFPRLNWDPKAERIHGIVRRDLAVAADPQTVAGHLTDLFSSSFARGEPILLCGQNPTYDRYFLNQLFYMAGQEPPKLHSRMIDTFSLGLVIWGHYTGDDLFEHVTGAKRTLHSALGDAQSAYQALKFAIQQTSRNKIGVRSGQFTSGTK